MFLLCFWSKSRNPIHWICRVWIRKKIILAALILWLWALGPLNSLCGYVITRFICLINRPSNTSMLCKYAQGRRSNHCHRAMARVDFLPRPESQYICWAPRKKVPLNPQSGTGCFYPQSAPMRIHISFQKSLPRPLLSI